MYGRDPNNETTPSGGNDFEYSFKRDDLPYRTYMDANYEPQREEQRTPRQYYTPPEKPRPKKREKRGLGAIGIIALCLICAILGGLTGGYAAVRFTPEAPRARGGTLNIAMHGPIAAPRVSPVVSGEILTGTQIYEIGRYQTVGIQTEITHTNFLGMSTSTAVSGSGFIVTSNGYIVTNYHVISDAYNRSYTVTVMLYGGERHEAEIVGVEPANDIAVLRINASGLSPVTFGQSENMRVGETIFTIGNPLGELSFTMTSGMVSALDRRITTRLRSTGGAATNNMFQIDAAVNNGNSGGPVFNDRGEVIGIVTAKYADAGVEGLGFAIPTHDAIPIIDDLINVGYVTGRPSFGIMVSTVRAPVARYYEMVQGAFVEAVNEGSSSERAGVLVGDIITALNDVQIQSVPELAEALRSYRAGDTVTLTIFRGGEHIYIQVTLDERVPESVSRNANNRDNVA